MLPPCPFGQRWSHLQRMCPCIRWLQIGHQREGALYICPLISFICIIVLCVIDYLKVFKPARLNRQRFEKGMGVRIDSPVYTFALCIPVWVHISNVPLLSFPAPPLSSFFLCVVLQMRLSALWGKAPSGGWCSALTTAGVCHSTLINNSCHSHGSCFWDMQ